MAEPIIREWLADCKNSSQASRKKSKALSPTEVHSFTCTIVQNNELIQGIFSILEDRIKQQELLESVCNQLFSFFRSKEVELQRFALQYLPAMIGSYLASVAQGDKKNSKCIEVLLLSVYNLEVVDAHGKAKTYSFRMPCVAQPSIYHTPISLASAALTENALSRLEKSDNQIIAIGPFPQVESLNAQNRMKVMTVLMNVYNRNLSYMAKAALQSLCKMCARVAKQGFGKQGSHHRSSYGTDTVFGNPYTRPPCRIPLTSPFLLEVIHGVYFSMFNGMGVVGIQALDEVHARASHDLMADVLLVTNGVRNSLHANPIGQPGDGPMGISISLSPTTSMNTVSKSIVTNASFRTKKLPDDIPIQTGGTPGGGGGNNTGSNKEGDGGDAAKSLATISEEASVDTGNEGVGDVRHGQHGSGKPAKEKGSGGVMGAMMSKITEKTKKRADHADSPGGGATGSATSGKTPGKDTPPSGKSLATPSPSSNGTATDGLSSGEMRRRDVTDGGKVKNDGTKIKAKVKVSIDGAKANSAASSPAVQNGDAAAMFAAATALAQQGHGAGQDTGVRNSLVVTSRTHSRSSLTDGMEMVKVVGPGAAVRLSATSRTSAGDEADGQLSDGGSISSAHSSLEADNVSSTSGSPLVTIGSGHRHHHGKHHHHHHGNSHQGHHHTNDASVGGHRRSGGQPHHNQDGSISSLSETQTVV